MEGDDFEQQQETPNLPGLQNKALQVRGSPREQLPPGWGVKKPAGTQQQPRGGFKDSTRPRPSSHSVNKGLSGGRGEATSRLTDAKSDSFKVTG